MSRFIIFLSIVTAVILLTDIYGSFGLRQLTHNLDPVWKKVWRYAYWSPTVITFSLFVTLILWNLWSDGERPFGLIYFTIGFTFLFFIPKLFFSIFHLADDITHLVRWLFSKFTVRSEAISTGERIT